MTGKRKAPVFAPFPVPAQPNDVPLVTRAGGGDEYHCSGCGGSVPAGSVLRETVEDGMVTGITAQAGFDGPVVHDCGTAYPGDLPTKAFDLSRPGW